jgi:hypothetical protein
MSFLIFDVDHSLASIGGDIAAEKVSSIKPIKVTNGSSQVMGVLSSLFTKKEANYEHPLLPGGMKISFYDKSELAKTNQLEGLIIDTLSHLFRTDMRILESKNKSERLEIQDWGKLEKLYNSLIASLIQMPVWVIVNSHISYDKNDLGQMLFYPSVKGGTKDFLGEYFDLILYTKVTNANGRVQYLWQTKPDSQRFAKDRLDVLEQYIPQDFSLIIQRYKEKGIENPKILVIGESGTGKTRSLLSLNKESENPINYKGNGRLLTKTIN